MIKKYAIAVSLIVFFLFSCTTADIDPETYEANPIFIGSCDFDVIHPGQNRVYWMPGRVALTSNALVLFGPDSRNNRKYRKIQIPLSFIEGIDLKGIGHGRQLQVKAKERVIAIEVISSDFPTEKSAAQELHDAMVSLGVKEWNSKKLYPSPPKKRKFSLLDLDPSLLLLLQLF